MVNVVPALEQEAEEKIGEKQLEIAGLKETSRACHTAEDRDKLLHVPSTLLNEGSTQQDSILVVSSLHKEHDRNSDFLRSRISEVKEQLVELKKEVNNVKGGNRCGRINSGDELVGSDGIFLEEVSERLIGVDSTFDAPQSTLDSFFSQLKDMVHISKKSLRKMQQEWELRAEIEAIVMTGYIRSLHSEFERKFWDLNGYSHGSENLSSLKKIKEITAPLREELVMLSNLLSGNDNGQLISQVSLEDGEECLISKRTDHLNQKLSKNLDDELMITMPENLDPAQLKNMGTDEWICYFKTEMTKMKRYHESKAEKMTEEYFSLKREYFKKILNEPSLTVRKDKEFEGLKRKISDVISKLDDILRKSNSVPQSNGDAGSFGTMRARLEDLLAENHQLRSVLSDMAKKKNIREDVHEIANVAECSCQYEFENLNTENAILQGVEGMIFAEVLKDAKEKLCHLNFSYINEIKLRVSLEWEATERERSLESKISENEKLKQEATQLAVSVEEREKLAQETARKLSIQMEQREMISQGLDHLKAELSRQKILIAKMNKESELMKGNLAQGLKQIKVYERESNNLNEKLDLAVEELIKANIEKELLLAANQEKENALQLLRNKERENLEQLELTSGTVYELLKKVADFEQSISENIQGKNMSF
ncbi:hypothetical protein EUGRSUZ_E02499 [Eucalyptus grandis]|uniref:Uncharacterized protein n=2 Tax=Eucalyptus grandis TaxID=71139 RepID=A0ACC3KWU6_EUCGR|nr:hypothetical protein EUGRSUZ_E02499 [Eucalyptus grandis]